jgi:hypothetical protein
MAMLILFAVLFLSCWAIVRVGDGEPKQNDSDIYSEQFYANEWIEE